MQTPAIKFVFRLRALLLLAVIPALTNCSRIDGSVELIGSSGEPYSFAGAKVDVFNMDRAAAIGGANKTLKSTSTVDADGNTISLQVITATIDDDALYDVEISCPANNTTDACNVESTVHMALSGAQLKAGGWIATALTEAIFYNIAYYSAVSFDDASIERMQDSFASILLAEFEGVPKTYANVLKWNPTLTNRLRRPGMLGRISDALAQGDSNFKLLSRQWFGPYVGSINLSAQIEPSFFYNFAIANGYAYIGSLNAGLSVVDIHNPEQLTLAGTTSQSSTTRYDVKVSGTHVYTVSDGGLYIFDVSNPQLPALVGQLFLDYDAKSVEVSGNYAYVLEDGSFFIVDISNPAAPVSKGKVSAGFRTIAVDGTTVGVIDEAVSFVDVSNPAVPNIVGELDVFEAVDIKIRAGYAYITVTDHATGFSGLDVVDIHNLSAPTVVAQLPLADIGNIEWFENQLYVSGTHTISRVDISNPGAPRLTAAINTPDSFTAIAADKEFLYTLTFGKTLSAIDVDHATGIVIEFANLPTTVLDHGQISVAGDFAYLVNRNTNAGLSIITDIPATPHLVTTYTSDWYLDGAAVSGDYVFGANASLHAMTVTDVSNPQAPFTLENYLKLDESTTNFNGPTDIALAGDHAYLPWGSFTDANGNGPLGCSNPATGQIGGLFVADISTPTAPAIAAHVCLTRHADIVAASGDRAYVALASDLQEFVNANHPATLQVIDVSDPTMPLIAGSVALSSKPNFIAVNGDHLWVAEGNDGIDIIDASNADAPVIASHIETSGHVASVTFDERHAYVANGYNGVLIFDITNPAAPTLAASANTLSNAIAVTVAGNYLYAATGYGVEVFETLPEK